MFSLLSLYFASRKDVVLAERHMDGLHSAAQQGSDAATAVETEETAVTEVRAAKAEALSRAA